MARPAPLSFRLPDDLSAELEALTSRASAAGLPLSRTAVAASLLRAGLASLYGEDPPSDLAALRTLAGSLDPVDADRLRGNAWGALTALDRDDLPGVRAHLYNLSHYMLDELGTRRPAPWRVVEAETRATAAVEAAEASDPGSRPGKIAELRESLRDLVAILARGAGA